MKIYIADQQARKRFNISHRNTQIKILIQYHITHLQVYYLKYYHGKRELFGVIKMIYILIMMVFI
jgi:hypothetical protein